MIEHPWFAACPKGLESLLAQELESLGAVQIKQTVAGVAFTCSVEIAYRICLWSRLANRILLPLAKIPADTVDAMYNAARDIRWEEHIRADGNLWIDFVGQNDAVRHTQFGAQKIKDAIVDRLREKTGLRPTIEREFPDLVVNVRLNKSEASINIDLCGDSLHRRGYRTHQVAAPLKENLAAALLIRSGWQANWQQFDALLDPMCGSGTFLIEAALMAADIAPAKNRVRFAFERWLQHQPSVWQALRAEADERAQIGLNKPLPEIRGYDADINAVVAAEKNIDSAELSKQVRVVFKPLAEFKKPTHKTLTSGLIITNPPYGERLGDEESLRPLYQQLGRTLKEEFTGWQAAVFTGNIGLAKAIGLRAHKKYKFLNGTIPGELLLFDISNDNALIQRDFLQDFPQDFPQDKAPADGQEDGTQESGAPQSHHAVAPLQAVELSEGATMVANRLKKNSKALAGWLKQSNTNCYRLYDADLPEYAAAIDIYGDYVHIQEYAAPKTVDADKAEQRFDELVAATKQALNVDDEHLSIKQRKRNRGKEQYDRLGDDPFANMLQVYEGQAKFWVNLWTYLDTGLFLDHRLVRQKVAELVLGKRFLNLFCYTATATVQAAIGGARSSVSVDMSNTYLDWAEHNFVENRLSDRHELVQADCLAWLKACREPFDVILLDPPSFSNSKRMEGVLDVQRDHVMLIERCVELLKPGGTLVFSTNLRSFKLDSDALSRYRIEDFNQASIDKDFQRNPRIHYCFLIRA